MSKQVGLIKLNGKIDGISFFQSGGEHLARMARGPSRRRILTDPGFARTRENNSEFGGSATVAKALRMALSPVLYMADGRFSSRLTGIFKEVNRQGTGARGQRTIHLTANKVQLANTEFHAGRVFTSLFTAPFVATNTADRTAGIITFTDVLLSRALKVPAGATHVKFIQALGVLSNYDYDADMKRYRAAEPRLDQCGDVSASDYMPVQGSEPASLALSTALPQGVLPTEQVSVVQCFGLVFYQQVGTEYSPLLQGNAMKIVRVF